MKTHHLKRYICLILGNILIGFGIAIFLQSNLGIDPFTLMNKGLSDYFNINFSILQWGIGGVLLAIIAFVDRKKIFIGTVINMFLIAPLIQGFEVLIDKCNLLQFGLFGAIGIALIGCTILSIGAGMYLGADLGMAPYDLISVIIAEKKEWPFKWVRMVTDGICVIIGFVTGAVIGLGTLIAVFGMGPIIGYFKKRVEDYLK